MDTIEWVNRRKQTGDADSVHALGQPLRRLLAAAVLRPPQVLHPDAATLYWSTHNDGWVSQSINTGTHTRSIPPQIITLTDQDIPRGVPAAVQLREAEAAGPVHVEAQLAVRRAALALVLAPVLAHRADATVAAGHARAVIITAIPRFLLPLGPLGLPLLGPRRRRRHRQLLLSGRPVGLVQHLL